MPLPTDVKEFFLQMLAQPVFLGIVVAAGLEALFNYWEARTKQPIQPYDKTLISAVSPPVVALVLYAVAAGIGFVPWSWADAAQAVYNGVLAGVGGQIIYGGVKKLINIRPVQNITTTNINTVEATRDTYVGSEHTEENHP